MGGDGSGRERTRPTVEDAFALDAVQVHRALDLSVASSGEASFPWRRGIRWEFGFTVAPRHHYVEVSAGRFGGAAIPRQTFLLPYEWTEPHFGGRRPWWRCSWRGCARRVARLYLLPGRLIPACRRCAGLSYASKRLDRRNRLRLRWERLADRHGIIEGEGGWIRPTGMHRAHFDQIREQLDELRHAEEEQAIGDVWSKPWPSWMVREMEAQAGKDGTTRRS